MMETDIQLTREQFSVLAHSAENNEVKLEALERESKMDLSRCRTICLELEQMGFMRDGKLTVAGFEALEPYRVKRAIFIAAGFGSRLVPITLNTPKPLVRVHGVRMIDTLIDAVLGAGIEEIVIVRGYLLEQFDQLLYKYPMIKFIDNPTYNEANNIMSIYRVRDILGQAYVFEADLVLSNPKIIKKYQYSSCFMGVHVEETDDWCFRIETGRIAEQAIGGTNCYQQIGISYWDAADGKKLEKDIEEASRMENGKALYWDQVPLKVFNKKYCVEISECCAGDIVEIDTFNELKQIDESYRV